MKHVLWLMLLPVIAAGCLGVGEHAASPGATASDLPLTESSPPVHIPLTELRFSYPVGDAVVIRSHLAGCPSRVACRDLHLPSGCGSLKAYCPPRPWLRVAHRRLTCFPSGGDYGDPKAACAALDDLEQRISVGPPVVCSCPLELAGHQRATATGRYNGRRVTLALDFCSLCGLGTQAAHDAAVLMPQT